MHHAIELLFDAGTERTIRGLWQRLVEAEIPCALQKLGASPHVSLGVYDTPLPDSWVAEAAAFFAERPPIELTFSSVGTFAGTEGVVFLAPVVTEALLDLHRAYHDTFAAHRASVRPYYLPGAWVPHCTLGIFLAQAEVDTGIEPPGTQGRVVRDMGPPAGPVVAEQEVGVPGQDPFPIPVGRLDAAGEGHAQRDTRGVVIREVQDPTTIPDEQGHRPAPMDEPGRMGPLPEVRDEWRRPVADVAGRSVGRRIARSGHESAGWHQVASG